jgi:hypothetical protein
LGSLVESGALGAFFGLETVTSSALRPKGWLMPKALCLIGLVFSALVFLIFFVDLVLGMLGSSLAPLMMASWLMDILFMLASAALAYAAWIAYKEQR